MHSSSAHDRWLAYWHLPHNAHSGMDLVPLMDDIARSSFQVTGWDDNTATLSNETVRQWMEMTTENVRVHMAAQLESDTKSAEG